MRKRKPMYAHRHHGTNVAYSGLIVKSGPFLDIRGIFRRIVKSPFFHSAPIAGRSSCTQASTVSSPRDSSAVRLSSGERLTGFEIIQRQPAHAEKRRPVVPQRLDVCAPGVVTVTKNGPFTGVTITSDFAVVFGTRKNQMPHTRRIAETVYVTAGRRVNRARSAGGTTASNREEPGRLGMRVTLKAKRPLQP